MRTLHVAALATLLAPMAVLVAPADALAQGLSSEGSRLVEECNKLAKRNAWAGVERCYERLIELAEPIPLDVHLLGAQSARSLGKTLQVYERLVRAKNLEPSEEVLQNLSSIDEGFGRIDLKGKEGSTVTLTPAQMPFAPDARRSIEWAQEVLTATGSFHGMLPRGDYSVVTPKEEQKFSVAPGPDWQLVVLKGGPSVSVQWAGPFASLGYDLGIITDPADPGADGHTDIQPVGFIGNGLGVTAGFELGFNKKAGLGLAAGVAYDGLFGVNSLHSVGGFLAAVIRPGELRIAVGPMYALRIGSGTGVADWYDVGHDQERWNPELKYRGMAGGVGGVLTVGYSLVDLGDSLRAGAELGASFTTDGSRLYLDAGVRVNIVPHLGRFEN